MSSPSGSSYSGSDRNDRITTLFIRPVTGELVRDEILSHFSAFGDVDDICIRKETRHSYGKVDNVRRVCKETKHSFGFVTFTQPEFAAKALGVEYHEIAGRRVKIAAASDRYQERATPLNDDASTLSDLTSFMDLNDDCIIEILSMKCLNARDLCSVAETSRRLKDIARQAFKREHKECNINLLSEVDTKTAQRILRNFGSEMSDLRIHGGTWSRNVLAHVLDYCNSSSLQSLHLQDFEIPQDFTAKLRPLLKNLQKLAIFRCTIEGASNELFADCGSLIDLDISQCDKVAALAFENTFPKLQEFKFFCSDELASLESFIARHTNLKSMGILSPDGSPVLTSIVACERLETLRCDVRLIATLDLSSLGHLKELDINYANQNFTTAALVLEHLNCLQSLKLTNAEIDSEFVRTLSQMERLQVLELRRFDGLRALNQVGDLGQLTTLLIHARERDVDVDFARLVERLSKLNSLAVSVRGFEMNLETYMSIVNVVRQRPDRSKLTFRLSDFGRVDYDHLLADFARNAHVVEMIVDRIFS